MTQVTIERDEGCPAFECGMRFDCRDGELPRRMRGGFPEKLAIHERHEVHRHRGIDVVRARVLAAGRVGDDPAGHRATFGIFRILLGIGAVARDDRVRVGQRAERLIDRLLQPGVNHRRVDVPADAHGSITPASFASCRNRSGIWTGATKAEPSFGSPGAGGAMNWLGNHWGCFACSFKAAAL